MLSMITSLSKRIGTLVLIILLISSCQPVSTGTEIPVVIRETSPPTSMPTPTPTPTLTATRTPTITPTIEPSPTRHTSTPIEFPEEDYPPPLPLLFGAWPATSGCPNHAGLQDVDDLPAEAVIHAVGELLYTGDKLRERAVSDPALWPLLPFASRSERSMSGSVDENWIDSVLKTNQTDYAKLVINQCGEKTAGVTWVAKICPGPCAANPSESLKDDLFFIQRNGRWLVWALY